jgi:hypothetical protein
VKSFKKITNYQICYISLAISLTGPLTLSLNWSIVKAELILVRYSLVCSHVVFLNSWKYFAVILALNKFRMQNKQLPFYTILAHLIIWTAINARSSKTCLFIGWSSSLFLALAACHQKRFMHSICIPSSGSVYFPWMLRRPYCVCNSQRQYPLSTQLLHCFWYNYKIIHLG